MIEMADYQLPSEKPKSIIHLENALVELEEIAGELISQGITLTVLSEAGDAQTCQLQILISGISFEDVENANDQVSILVGRNWGIRQSDSGTLDHNDFTIQALFLGYPQQDVDSTQFYRELWYSFM